ncbi:DUF2927 domain-containing protein [uncultured Aquimarina sp.]|uniref:DUF2927 domain-containing protein n=1 Tax=uncultured Aquimarina sp. TaxID=575652 RepID=UPI00260C2E87|nr:DUF2927 domain-containing protein [uncultured Aquimarina sp.]
MKSTIRFFLCITLVIFVSSCSSDDDIASDAEIANEEVIEYFKDIALGFEFGSASRVTRKWNTDMKIFVGGNPSDALTNELNKIVNEINNLTTDGFSVSIVDSSSQSNFFIFFGSGDDYADLYPGQEGFVESNWGLFSIFWLDNQLNSGHMYVDIFRANAIEQRHLLREELTQSLGLARDSFRYDDSIFQSEWTRTTEYSEIDRELIRLLYHPDMNVGLDENEVDPILRNILFAN